MPIRIVDEPQQKFQFSGDGISPTPQQWDESFAPNWNEKIALDKAERQRRLEAATRERELNTASLMANKGRENTMPIKIIDEATRKPRRIMTGKVASLPEMSEVWEAIRDLPKGKAVEVSLSPATLAEWKKDGVKNPARTVVNALRRKFVQNSLPFDVYANDETSLTVLREAAPKPPADGKGKKK